MGKLSEDGDSDSSSSSSEFLVPANKIDLSSEFFSDQKPKKQPAKPKPKANRKVVLNGDSSDSDDELDGSNEDNISSAELLSQVLKNLESSKQSFGLPNAESGQPSTSGVKQPSDSKADLSKEIEDLLKLGESQDSLSNVVDEPEVKQESKEDVKDSYAIPEKGIQIHLPGQNFLFDKKTKKQQDLQKALQNKINQRVRKNQVYIHKTGLLCWFAHGFLLNKLANHPDLLKHAMSLVAPQNYPKNRPDLKYFEKFTKWFVGLFKVCEDHKATVFNTDLLIQRVKDKKVYNYIELVLLYIATVRGLGINCRLVISLQPPRLKPRPNQLFKIPIKENNPSNKSIKEEDDDDDDEEMEDVTEESNKKGDSNKTLNKSDKNKNVAEKSTKKDATKKTSAKTANSTSSRKRPKTKEQSVSPPKVIPQNSREAAKAASEEAKKKAAALLKGKSSASSLKTCKVVLNRSLTEEDVKETNKSVSVKNTNTKNKSQDDNNKADENIINNKNKSNQENKRKQIETDAATKKGIQKRKLKKTKHNSSDDSDDENEHNMSIARKLSLRVKKKTATKKKNKALVDAEMSEPEEEVTSSSEFSLKDENESSDDYFSSDSEYEDVKPKKKTVKQVNKRRSSTGNQSLKTKPKNFNKNLSIASKLSVKNPRKLISSDDDAGDDTGDVKGYNVWVEVYVEAEESWISVSILDQKIHCVSELFKKANQPVLYVIAWNSEGTIKDVTRRYCPHWLTDTRKKRVEEKWWNETLSYWKEEKSVRSKAEDEQLLQRELEQPLPKTLSECKGHPLYVLQRHLLKFEALYPPDAVPLGHLKTGEAIYSRHCVHTLMSRETWVKKARVVKPAQEPYKIVKAMPKYDKLSGMKIKDQPLELFGKWQTNPYEPPVAKDGKVPRNEYGNVDLFKMCMLPKGCVYIDLPALNRLARKLNIDCAPACVGFNFGCRGALPAFQGFVVCEEYEDTLREAWEEEQVLAQQRAKEKREKRIYGNWKKLIKGLLIREKLAAKYNFREDENAGGEDEEDVGKRPPAQKRKPIVTKKAVAPAVSTKRGRSKQESDDEESDEAKEFVTKKRQPITTKRIIKTAVSTKTKGKRGRHKQESDEEESEEEEESSDEDVSYDEEDEEEEEASAKKTKSIAASKAIASKVSVKPRARRGISKEVSYREENTDDEEEEEEEEVASDEKKKSVAKKVTTEVNAKGKKEPPKQVSDKKESNDEDDDEEEKVEEAPNKQRKSTGKKVITSKASSKSNRKRGLSRQSSDEEDSNGEEEKGKKEEVPSKRRRSVAATKDVSPEVSTNTKGKRGRPKQEPSNPKKKLKK